jgi:hypothetical protein
MNILKNRHFCIFDYFLDGVFLKWEEIEGKCPILVTGQQWKVNLEDGTEVVGEIMEIVSISENECRILLRSC